MLIYQRIKKSLQRGLRFKVNVKPQSDYFNHMRHHDEMTLKLRYLYVEILQYIKNNITTVVNEIFNDEFFTHLYQ